MSLAKSTALYTGEVTQCVKQGKGTYKYPGGLYSYDGPWVDGKKHGSDGKFVLLDGANYVGDFNDGEMTGKGIKTWSDGRSYAGDFHYGEMNGKGVWKSADGKEIYEGEFVSNRREGRGYYRLSNGDTYNGTFSRHRFHGIGSYLRENCYIIESTFENGLANGKGSIQWHKVGSYDGSIQQGNIHGYGIYSAFNGSYKYQGLFDQGIPSYTIESLNLFIDKSFIRHDSESNVNVTQTSTKGKDKSAVKKKEAPKKKKGESIIEALTNVFPGEEIGKIIFLMTTNTNTVLDESSAEWKYPLSLPNKSELYRSFRLRMREYFPPPPPGKGESTPTPNPEKEMGRVIPLWQRKLTIEDKSGAWGRFPVSDCLRYIGGVNDITGEKVNLDGSTLPFTKDVTGVTSAKVPQSAESSVSITFSPQSLQTAHEKLVFLTDFRLEFDSSVGLESMLVNNKGFDELPILSLCNKVGELEGRSRLELLLLRPTGESVDASWFNCIWEVRLCEGENTYTEKPLLDTDDEVNTNTESKIVEKYSVLCRWADNAVFDSSKWHSVALTLQSSNENSKGNVELTVDGTGRMKVDGVFEEGVAAAWLPPPTSASVVDRNENDKHEVTSDAQMVFRVGRGSFGGFVKSLVLIAGCQGSEVQGMTSSFADEPNEITLQSSNEKLDDEDDDEEEAPSSIPADMIEVEEIGMFSCGGRGCVNGLFVPSSTSPGTYVLEVIDNVDVRCLASSSKSDVVPESDFNLPGDVAPLCQLVPPAGSSFMKYKIVVE